MISNARVRLVGLGYAVALAALLCSWPAALFADAAPSYRPHGKTQLHTDLIEACHDGKVDEARSLLQRGASPTWEVPSRFEVQYRGPAILTAAEAGQVEIGRLLLDQRPGLLKSHGDQLWLAVLQALTEAEKPERERYVKLVKLLIERKIDLNRMDPIRDKTPLMLAVSYGSLDAVRVLLDGGADAKLKNSRGETALSIAQTAKNPKPDHAAIIQLLAPSTK